jgi:hypothetical protein
MDGSIMASSITQLVVGIAVVIRVAVVTVGPIGSADAQSPIEIIALEALTNRPETQLSETDFRLSDRQELRGYFLDGSRERFR